MKMKSARPRDRTERACLLGAAVLWLCGSACSSGPSPSLDAGFTPDLANCAGGYLNSTAANACPLRCSPLVEPVSDEGHMHVPFNTPVTYRHNPPASGTHWPSPAPWGLHSEAVAREWWVHNLEHGGIVFLYNCPSGCPEVVSAFVQLHDQQPETTFPATRILITPDPLLPGRLAALAWDWSYVSDPLDMAALSCILQARYGRGPENAP